MKCSISAILVVATAGVTVTAAPVEELNTRDLDFKLQWYRDTSCRSYIGEYDFNSGGIFGSGDTPENCKNIALSGGIAANIIGGDVGATCQLYNGQNCKGTRLALIDEGTFGHFGNSKCVQLAANVQSFFCQMKGTPI